MNINTALIYVWREGDPPWSMMAFASLAAAQTFARNMAQSYPGTHWHVLTSTGFYTTATPAPGSITSVIIPP